MANDARSNLRWAMPLGNGGDIELIVRAHLPIDPGEAAILSQMLDLVTALIRKETAPAAVTEDIESAR